MSSPTSDAADPGARPGGALYDELHATPEFAELKRRFINFVLPATIVFMAWYLLYVVMSNWATGFMDTVIVGHINVALVFGLLQFVSTFLIAWLYGRHMNKNVDPIAKALLERYNDAAEGGVR